MATEKESAEIVHIEEISSEVVFQQDRALVDAQVATAHQYPRNIKRATENAIAIVTMDKETAATCTYSVPRGGKAITGPSVHLAKILAQVWGNMRVEAKVISIDAKQVTSMGVAWDLESNLAIKVEVKRSIVSKTTGRYNDDLVTVTGNANNAIALRNAVFAVIPRAVVDRVYNASKALITGDLSTETKLIARRKEVVDALKDTYSVTEAEILSAIGKASTTHITADDIVTLIGIGTAIKDGDATIENSFRKGKSASPDAVTFDEVDKLFAEKKEKIPVAKVKDYRRILDGKEDKSYEKMKKELLAL